MIFFGWTVHLKRFWALFNTDSVFDLFDIILRIHEHVLYSPDTQGEDFFSIQRQQKQAKGEPSLLTMIQDASKRKTFTEILLTSWFLTVKTNEKWKQGDLNQVVCSCPLVRWMFARVFVHIYVTGWTTIWRKGHCLHKHVYVACAVLGGGGKCILKAHEYMGLKQKLCTLPKSCNQNVFSSQTRGIPLHVCILLLSSSHAP